MVKTKIKVLSKNFTQCILFFNFGKDLYFCYIVCVAGESERFGHTYRTTSIPRTENENKLLLLNINTNQYTLRFHIRRDYNILKTRLNLKGSEITPSRSDHVLTCSCLQIFVKTLLTNLT
jgi:hypothetical protein